MEAAQDTDCAAVHPCWELSSIAARLSSPTAGVANGAADEVALPCDSRQSLVTLPQALQREILSWSPDSATANMLLNASSGLHRLRRDPTAAALLLLRCPPCQDYEAALARCATTGGSTTAVMRHILRLLTAGPESGGPYSALPSLLQAMLAVSCVSGDEEATRALLTLPQPPDGDAGDGRALFSAIQLQPHVGVVELLLGAGADPCGRDLSLFYTTAGEPGQTAVLELLLQHCPAVKRSLAVNMALYSAMLRANITPMARLLARVDSRGGLTDAAPFFTSFAAGCGGSPAVLQELLQHVPLSLTDLNACLVAAASAGRLANVATLLAHGALASHDSSSPLLAALAEAVYCRIGTAEMHERCAIMALLLRHGASATPAVLGKAKGRADLLGLLLPQGATEQQLTADFPPVAAPLHTALPATAVQRGWCLVQ